MSTILKGIQSVLIALGIIAVVGTGVILYYNKIKPEMEEEAATVVETESPADTLEISPNDSNSSQPDEVPEDDTSTPGAQEHTAPYIEGHEHTYKSTVIKPSTCSEPGEVKYTCYCGDSYVDAIKVKDHTKGQWVTMRAATDTQTGLRQKSCTVCGKVLEEETIPMLNTSSSSSGKDKSKDKTTDHTHSYTYEISEEATCTEKGKKTYTCTICGSTFETDIAATNHPSRRTVRTEGDCNTPGTIETVCNLCDAVISSESIKYEHDWGDWAVTTAATATSKGVKTRTCKDCGEIQTRSTNATSVTPGANTGTGTGTGGTTGGITGGNTTCSHKFNSQVTVNATCTSAGTTVNTCTLCGATSTEAAPAALGHLSGNWTIIKKATTTEEGERVKYCTRCGDISEREIIAKIPEVHKHVYEPTVIKNPSCTQTGIRKYLCACGDYYTSSIAPTGHTYANGYCSVCGIAQ